MFAGEPKSSEKQTGQLPTNKAVQEQVPYSAPGVQPWTPKDMGRRGRRATPTEWGLGGVQADGQVEFESAACPGSPNHTWVRGRLGEGSSSEGGGHGPELPQS